MRKGTEMDHAEMRSTSLRTWLGDLGCGNGCVHAGGAYNAMGLSWPITRREYRRAQTDSLFARSGMARLKCRLDPIPAPF